MFKQILFADINKRTNLNKKHSNLSFLFISSKTKKYLTCSYVYSFSVFSYAYALTFYVFFSSFRLA